jgi:glyoxylase-like metal-dependent hydrolase (beta-lactamase superfamily II)
MKSFFTFRAVLLGCALAAQVQQDFSKVEIKTVHVAGNIYMLQGAGGNIGVSAGVDGILIVDDQYAPLADKIEAALKKLNPGRLTFVLNTHYHGDHTGGNGYFGRQAPIIAQTNVRKRLAADKVRIQGGLPVITFDDSLSIHFNGEEVKAIHVPPGHTDNDTIIHFSGANVIHMGDQFFSGRFPNIDLGGGGSVRGYITNVQHALETLPVNAKLIPGHGPLSSQKELKEFHVMLTETAGIVERSLAAGKTVEEIKTEGLPEKYKIWEAPTVGTTRWLEILYQGLK